MANGTPREEFYGEDEPTLNRYEPPTPLHEEHPLMDRLTFEVLTRIVRDIDPGIERIDRAWAAATTADHTD